MNYQIEYNQMEDLSISKKKFLTYKEGNDFLKNKGWYLIDDICMVWGNWKEMPSITARVIKVVRVEKIEVTCRNCDNIVESDDSNKPKDQCDFCYVSDRYHSMSKKHQTMLKIHLGIDVEEE